MGMENNSQTAENANKPKIVQQATSNSCCLRCYVGHIHPNVSDDFMLSLLKTCGAVRKWTRDRDPSSQQLASFGFVEYEHAAGVYKALTLLNETKNYDSPLLLRVQDKIRGAAEAWKKSEKRRLSEGGKTETEVEALFQQSMNQTKEEIEKLISALPPLSSGYETSVGRVVPTASTILALGGRLGIKCLAQRDEDLKKPKSAVLVGGQEVEIHQEKFDRPTGLSKVYTQSKRERARLARFEDYESRVLKKYRRLLADWKGYEEKRTQEWRRQLSLPDDEKDKIIARELQGEIIESRKKKEEQMLRRQLEAEADAEDRDNESKEKQAKKRTYTITKDGAVKSEGLSNEGEEMKLKVADPKLQKRVVTDEQVATAFGDDDDSGPFSREHKPLTKLEQSKDITNQKQEANEKKKVLELSREILAQIPSDKEELFGYPLDWTIIEEQNIVEKKLKPWVGKKVMEYMGTEESLVEEVIRYVIGRVNQRPDPRELLCEVVRFLDEEGESFVKNMWRMLVFEEKKYMRAVGNDSGA